MKKILFSIVLLGSFQSLSSQEYEEYAQAPVDDYGAREDYPAPEARMDERMEPPRDERRYEEPPRDDRSAYNEPVEVAPADNYRDDYRNDYPQESYPADDRAQEMDPPRNAEPAPMADDGYDDYDY